MPSQESLGEQAVSAPRAIRPTDPIGTGRTRLAAELRDQVCRPTIVHAVATANSNITHIIEVGPSVACYLLGYRWRRHAVPDRRSPRPLQRHAPIEPVIRPACTSPTQPERRLTVEPRAFHIATLGQISHDTARGAIPRQTSRRSSSTREAMRCLNCRL
jgi:hypothetical protein